MAKKKELGKGIRALLGNIENGAEKISNDVNNQSVSSTTVISIDLIEPNPNQPRKDFDEEHLQNLSTSIKTFGLIQPLTVRRLGSKYQLIAGERRYRASKRAGLKEVPVFIREVNDQELLEMALVENIQRADLNAIEIAITYQRLIDECNLTHELMADRVGKNRSTITNYTRLLKLPPAIQNGLKEGLISMGHARALAGIENQGLQLIAFNKVVTDKLSVRSLEDYIRKGAEDAPKSTSSVSDHLPYELKKMRDQLSHKFASKVKISRNKVGKGQVIFPFGSDDELNDLLDSFLD